MAGKTAFFVFWEKKKQQKKNKFSCVFQRETTTQKSIRDVDVKFSSF